MTALAALSTQPQLAASVSLAILLAPVAFTTGMTSPSFLLSGRLQLDVYGLRNGWMEWGSHQPYWANACRCVDADMLSTLFVCGSLSLSNNQLQQCCTALSGVLSLHCCDAASAGPVLCCHEFARCTAMQQHLMRQYVLCTDSLQACSAALPALPHQLLWAEPPGQRGPCPDTHNLPAPPSRHQRAGHESLGTGKHWILLPTC